MDGETVLVPGNRDVVATLDSPETGDTNACVVACPPHPQHGGHRSDPRLRAVSNYLVDRDIAVLRFDYGEWDKGYGECEDARNAVRWTAKRYDWAALFGFSFGGAIAALAAASVDVELAAVSLLAPTARLAADLDVAAAASETDASLQIIYGERDDTADWRPVVEQVRNLASEDDADANHRNYEIVGLDASHFFVGQHKAVATHVGRFLLAHLRPAEHSGR